MRMALLLCVIFLGILSPRSEAADPSRFKVLHCRSQDDRALLAVEGEGGFYVAGLSQIPNDGDISVPWILKVNKGTGEREWESLLPAYERNTLLHFSITADQAHLNLLFSSQGSAHLEVGQTLFFVTLNAKTGEELNRKTIDFSESQFVTRVIFSRKRKDGTGFWIGGHESDRSNEQDKLDQNAWILGIDEQGEIDSPKMIMGEPGYQFELVHISRWNPETLMVVLNKQPVNDFKLPSGHINTFFEAEVRMVEPSIQKTRQVIRIPSPEDKPKELQDLKVRLAQNLSSKVGAVAMVVEYGKSKASPYFKSRFLDKKGVRLMQFSIHPENKIDWSIAIDDSLSIASIEEDRTMKEIILAGHEQTRVDPFFIARVSLESGKKKWSRVLRFNQWEQDSRAAFAMACQDGGVFAVGYSTTTLHPKDSPKTQAYLVKTGEYGLTFNGIGVQK